MYDNYLAKRWVRKVDKRINTLHDEEIDDRIDLLYSLGYVYNPYYQEFRNYFIEKGLKAIAIYNLDEKGLRDIYEHQKSETIKHNGRETTIEEIASQIDKDRTSEIWLAIKLLTAPLSILVLISSFIFFYFGQLYVAAGLEFLSFVFLTHFVTKNATITSIEGKENTGGWWRKYELGFYLLGTLNIVYSIYLTYRLTDSYWMPIVIVFLIRYIVAKLAAKQAANEYFRVWGFMQTHNYAKLNGLIS